MDETMMKAMTALAVVMLACAAAGSARAQDVPEREETSRAERSHDRPHRDRDGGGRPVREAPRAAEAPRAEQAPRAVEPPRVRYRGDGGERPGDRPSRGGFAGQPDGARDIGRDRDGDRGRGDGDRRGDGRWDNDRRDDRGRGGDRRDWDDRRGSDRRDWDRGDRRNGAGYSRWERGRYPSVYVNPHRYRYSWRPPSGYYVRSWGFGEFLPRSWFGSGYWIVDAWRYDLPLPPPGYEWVRVGYDALLVDEFTGRIVQVVRNVFW
jgi:Ni/Co efflux regulator RcnB